MPIQATALNFYRRRQTFELLSHERPQSLSSVYTVVREVVAAVEERLRNLETSFYGPGGDAASEVRQWVVPLQLILGPPRLPGLVSKQQLEEIYDRHIDLADALEVDSASLAQIQQLVKKNISALREGFKESSQTVLQLLEFMSRYCLSFSTPTGDPYLETATNYERQRADLEKAIKLNIQNIGLMADKFDRDSLQIDHFDLTMKEMADKFRLDRSPIALAFPAACQNMRNACQGLLLWVTSDQYYAEYLTYDIKELEKKKEIQTKVSREATDKANASEYNVKALKKSVSDSSEVVSRLRAKEQSIKILIRATRLSEKKKRKEERKLRDKNKDVLVDLDVKEHRRLEMKLNGSLATRDNLERYDRLHSEILDLQTRKPAIERRITDLCRQQTWISEQQTSHFAKERELDEASEELKTVRRHAREAEDDLERMHVCLAKMKEIHLLKTSKETLKKLFHNMPINTKYAQTHPHKRKKDTLDRFCKFIASEIESDWIRLYRCLPFYPDRGQETIERDIDELTTRFLRNCEEQAHQALSRWRRMHTRAGAGSLRQALTDVRRRDIWERYDLLITPQPKPAPETKAQKLVHLPKINAKAKKRNKAKTFNKDRYLHFDV